MQGLLYNRPLGRLSRRWWFEAAGYADLAAIADFNLDRYAITVVPLANIATATVAELCVKRACTFAEWFAFTCSSTTARSYFDAGGIWRNDLAVDQPRFSWINGRRQLALNAQSSNGTRNSTMQGAAVGVLGSGGALPTNWATGGAGGLTIEVVSIGTEDGIPYIDLRYSGTYDGSGSPSLYMEAAGQVAATVGQSVAMSMYARLVGGSLSGITAFNVGYTENTGGTVNTSGVAAFNPTNAPLRTQRPSLIRVTTSAGTTSVRPRPRFDMTNGAAIDFTLRIGLPFIELNTLVSPAIPTSGSAVTRAIETAELSPVLEAILQRSAASVVVRGQNFLRAQGMMLGLTGSNSLLRSATGRTTAVIDGSSSLVSGGGTSFETAAWAAASAFDTSGRSIVRNGGTVTSDAGTPPATRTAAYLGRNGSGTLFGDGWYDWAGIAAARLSNARQAELAGAA